MVGRVEGEDVNKKDQRLKAARGEVDLKHGFEWGDIAFVRQEGRSCSKPEGQYKRAENQSGTDKGDGKKSGL